MAGKRYWTSYWKQRNWAVNTEGRPIEYSGGSFTKRGVSVGDFLYIISQDAGHLLLGGRLTVGEIVTRDEAVRLRKRNDLYPAPEWTVAEHRSGTALRQHRRLATEITKRLRFVTGRSEPAKSLLFVDECHLDRQTTRTVRELTFESAQLLDEIIEMTDGQHLGGYPLTVNSKLLSAFHRVRR